MAGGGFTKAGDVAQELLQRGLFDAASVAATRGVAQGQPAPPPGRPAGSPLQAAFSIEAALCDQPKLQRLLSPPEIEAAKIIQGRIGQAQAIRIRDLGVLLGQDWDDRAVKAAVERLRTLARMPIASTKAPPYGLFMPATAEEARETHDRLFGEGIRLIVHSQLFGRDKDLVRKLEGQLELTGAGS
jgi:hypothetical protein